MSDPERVWLAPECDDDTGEREWGSRSDFGFCVCAAELHPHVEYIRADVVDTMVGTISGKDMNAADKALGEIYQYDAAPVGEFFRGTFATVRHSTARDALLHAYGLLNTATVRVAELEAHLSVTYERIEELGQLVVDLRDNPEGVD